MSNLKTNGINGNTVAAYSSTEEREILLKEHGNTSSAIRFLLKQGMKQSLIARKLNIRPQHVNNVSRQILKGNQS